MSQVEALRAVSNWAVVLILTAVALITLWLMFRTFADDRSLFKQLLMTKTRGLIGIPMASSSAFCVVVLFEARAGDKIEFTAWGVSFTGASGPAVIWIFAFLAFGVVIRMLW